MSSSHSAPLLSTPTELPMSSDSTKNTLKLLQRKIQKLSAVDKTALVSQALWNAILVSAESTYSIATFVTDIFKLKPYIYSTSKVGLGVGAVLGCALGCAETLSHWALGSHFAHGDSHGHSHGGPSYHVHDDKEEEDKKEDDLAFKKATQLTWTQFSIALLHYLSDSVKDTATPLMFYKLFSSMKEEENPSLWVSGGVWAASFFCHAQTFLNTRSAFRKENERVAREAKNEVESHSRPGSAMV